MVPNEVKQLIRQYDLKPNKLLGQIFLVDEKVLEKILAAAGLSKNDNVLEVGPGLGVLTEKLAELAGQVIAVEKDKKLIEILKKQFLKVKNVEIIQGDILKEIQNSHPTGDHPKGEKFKIQNYKLVANIPYYLTSHLIREFLESANPPNEMILMIQKEVAQRICAQPPHMSLLAVATQFYAIAEICAIVSKNSFWPKPKVDSAIIKITPYSSPLYKRGVRGDLEIPPNLPLLKGGVNNFFRIVKAGFSQPRKQLINNLSRGLKTDRAEIAAILKKIGLAPEQRAETLSVTNWVKLTDLIYDSDSKSN